MDQFADTSLDLPNKFPDCVFLKLQKASNQSNKLKNLALAWIARHTLVSSNQTSLKLTIRFGKQEIRVPGGKVEFGLRKGELRLNLLNCKIPLEKMGLISQFQTSIEFEQQHDIGKEAEAALAVDKVGIRIKDIGKTGIKSKYITYKVSNRGTEEQPIWSFEVKERAEPILVGQITDADLGVVELQGENCKALATFVIRDQSDIYLFDSIGIFGAKELSRNKTAWATREFFLRYISPKLQPYLSQTEVQL